jgi:hypothetical protein
VRRISGTHGEELARGWPEVLRGRGCSRVISAGSGALGHRYASGPLSASVGAPRRAPDSPGVLWLAAVDVRRGPVTNSDASSGSVLRAGSVAVTHGQRGRCGCVL